MGPPVGREVALPRRFQGASPRHRLPEVIQRRFRNIEALVRVPAIAHLGGADRLFTERRPVRLGRVLDTGGRAETEVRARVPGTYAGRIEIAPDFDAPLPDDVMNGFNGGGS